MKAVLRGFSAWRRFFFFIGCNPLLHTVILNHVDSGRLMRLQTPKSDSLLPRHSFSGTESKQ